MPSPATPRPKSPYVVFSSEVMWEKDRLGFLRPNCEHITVSDFTRRNDIRVENADVLTELVIPVLRREKDCRCVH